MLDDLDAAPEPELLSSARRDDSAAFERLVAGYRGELYAHCYRMLGSVQDAEDALRGARAWSWPSSRPSSICRVRRERY